MSQPSGDWRRHLDARDPYTSGHSERVSLLSAGMGRHLALSEKDVELLRVGGLLHDIGKIGVPDGILQKAGRLSAEEFEIIKTHTTLGAKILKTMPFLAVHVPVAKLHHERLDGHGYPHGLRGDEIPVHARIVHVADAYDAMTTGRAYRGARTRQEGDRRALALRRLGFRCRVGSGARGRSARHPPPRHPDAGRPFAPGGVRPGEQHRSLELGKSRLSCD